MKRLAFIFLLLPLFAVSQDFVKKTPDWVKNPPKEKGKLYGVGTATASNMETAEQKALHLAKVHLAKQLGPVKKEVIRDSENPNEKVEKETVETEIREVELVKKAFRKKKGKYISYVLLELDKSKQVKE